MKNRSIEVNHVKVQKMCIVDGCTGKMKFDRERNENEFVHVCENCDQEMVYDKPYPTLREDEFDGPPTPGGGIYQGDGKIA